MSRIAEVTRTRLARLGAGLGATALALTVGVGAASADTSADEGWVRIAHLSPDTPDVDVQLAGIGSGEREDYENVGYADVSEYVRLPQGSYTVSMVPAGSAEGTEPVISQVFTIDGDRAYTVAAVGLNEDLSGRVITDDLEAPQEGESRVRLLQASVSSPSVDVQTDTGDPIAQDAEFGTATEYASVDAGRWTLEVSGQDRSGVVEVDLEPGSVNTLLAIDLDGEITIAAIQDSSGAPQTPSGGVATGHGGLHLETQGSGGVLGGLAVVLLIGTGVVLVRHRREST